MRVAFVGGHGHHYLAGAVEGGKMSDVLAAVGVASDGVDGEGTRRFHAARFADVPYYDDYRVMLDEVKPDVISVGAVYAYNGEVVCEGLRRGVRVCSDKPIADTLEQLSKVRELAEGGGNILLTEFDLRSDKAFRAAHEAVRLDLIGIPVMATGQKSYRFGDSRPDFYKRRESYGGTLLWIASHAIDFTWFVTGRRFEQVVGFQGNMTKPGYEEMEDYVALCYQLVGGGAAMVHADYLRPSSAPTHGDDRIRVVGSEGQLEVCEGRCMLITEEHGLKDVTYLGEGADLRVDLVDALKGDERYYSTAKSLYIAEVMLRSRDAADNVELLRLDNS